MRKIIIALLLSGLLSPLALAVDPIYTPWYNNLAIRGYDPVAYFTDGAAMEGRESFEYSWQGATWRFTSAEHQQAFMDNPTAYAPQYGGYCAYAVAENDTASIDPTQWSIIDGKLYLNYNRKIQQKWLNDTAGYIRAADQYWPSLLTD